MIDIAGAAQASSLLTTNTVLTSQGIFTYNSATKASLNVMVSMIYSLLYPKIHIDFPTRIESQQWLMQEITKGFATHHSQNFHVFSTAPISSGATTIMMVAPPIPIPTETALIKRGRPVPQPTQPTAAAGDDVPDVELSAPQTEPVMARALSVTENILLQG